MQHYKKKYFIILISILLIISGYYIHVIYNKLHVTTDNAHIIVEALEMQSKVNQKIKHIYVDNEQYVTLGEILLELEDQEYIDNITALQASLFLAKRQLEISTNHHQQASKLFAAKRISKQEYNLSLKDLEIATKKYTDCQELLDNAEKNLQHTKFYAPVSGWVTNFKAQHTEKVNQAQKILDIVNDKNFWVIANLTQKQLKYVKLHQQAKIYIKNVKDIADYKFLGKVTEINNIGKPLAKVKILITNNDFNFPLRSGMKAQVTIYTTPFVKPKINLNDKQH